MLLAPLVAVALTLGAQTPAASQNPSRPFRNLFKPDVTPPSPTSGAPLPRVLPLPLTLRQPQPDASPAPLSPGAPVVRCGLTIVPADSAVDPRIVKTPDTVRFTMRVVQPPLCR